MSVLPTPAVRADTFQAGLFRGLGLAQLFILKDEMVKGKLKVGQRRLTLASGVEILCKVTYNLEEVFITLPEPVPPELAKLTEVFALFPRSGKLSLLPIVLNGEEQSLVGVDGPGYGGPTATYLYPLLDNDGGTFVVQEYLVDGNGLKWQIRYARWQNYGNLWWVGADGSVTSWRGIPNRHFPLTSSTIIPGLSQIEEEVGTTAYYSCFGTTMYFKEGYVTLPHTVAAAWLYAGHLVHAAVINRRSTSGGFYFQLRSSTDGGATWHDIGGAAYLGHRCTYPAFPNPAGDRVAFENACYTLAHDPIDNTLIIVGVEGFDPLDAGTRTITGTGGYDSTYEYRNAIRRLWGECRDNRFIYSTVTHDATFTSVRRGATEEKKYDVPVYRHGPATALQVFLADPYGACAHKNLSCAQGSLYFAGAIANGSYCSIEWSGVVCADGPNAAFCDLCADTVVSATILPQNITATLTLPTDTPFIGGPSDRVHAGDQYVLNYARGDVRWSITGSCSPPPAINSDGIITQGAGGGTVVISATDACDRTATMTIILPNGAWRELPNQSTCSCYWTYCYDYGMPYWITDYSADGRYKYVYGVQAQCYDESPRCTTNLCNSGNIGFETTAWSVEGGYVTSLPTIIDKGQSSMADCCGAGRWGRYVCYQGCLIWKFEWRCQ